MLRAEHAVNTEAWGPEAADRTLERMLDLSQLSQPLAQAPPPAVQVHQQSSANREMAASFDAMSERFFSNSYFRSIDALLLLVTYRLSALVELLPLLGCLAVLGIVDALAVRQIRIRKLGTANAEVFSVQAVGAIVLLAITFVGLFVPVQLTPWMVSAFPIFAVLAITRSMSQYHAVR
ncbi:MAG TPA: DUF4400 domain-containing protein [Burkholderiaceae bacterium]|nr:DUF4400 domain-containing protein [Burkholderiaceae bacterium]